MSSTEAKAVSKGDERLSQLTNPIMLEDICGSHECRGLFIAEEDGYVAICENVPGVVSEGNTLDEAIRNLKEAFCAAIESYRSKNMEVPWNLQQSQASRESTTRRWLIVPCPK